MVLALAAAFAAPGALVGQANRVRRVALVFTTTPVAEMTGPEPSHPGARAFLEGLRAAGFSEPRNLIYEPRSAEGRYERYPEIFAELVQRGADVIVTVGDDMTRKARETTATIPIVMAHSTAPVEAGLVRSLARPGGNVTGVAANPSPQLEAKRLQLLIEAVPGVTRVAFLGLRSEWDDRLGLSVRAAAPALGVQLVFAESSPDGYAAAFAALAGDRPDALFVSTSPVNFGHRRTIVEEAAKARLPATYHAEEFVQAGGLMSYGTNVPELFRSAATIVGKLLNGANAATFPVERATVFDLVINLKTATSLGIRIPPALVLRANRIFE